MRGTTLRGLTCICAALAVAGCGSTAVPTVVPTQSSSAPSAVTPTPLAASRSDLNVVYTLLYPPTPSGGDCFQASGGAAATTSCPFTTRLTAAVAAAIAAQGRGGAADPVCGCQNVDPNQVASYTVGTPPGGGTIHVRSFGSPHVAFVVIWSGSAFLVDDILYCASTMTSIYPGEKPGSC
ncbi:MAG: hypothetical protein ABI352_10180 [Candidatus Dormibacter sp.]